jgi:hypothetical protein
MEKIMRKTNDNSNTLEHHNTLADSELAAVTGGSTISNVIDGITKATTAAASEGSGGTPLVWVGCAWVPQWW